MAFATYPYVPPGRHRCGRPLSTRRAAEVLTEPERKRARLKPIDLVEGCVDCDDWLTL